jgi:hypothetical protein
VDVARGAEALAEKVANVTKDDEDEVAEVGRDENVVRGLRVLVRVDRLVRVPLRVSPARRYNAPD